MTTADPTKAIEAVRKAIATDEVNEGWKDKAQAWRVAANELMLVMIAGNSVSEAKT